MIDWLSSEYAGAPCPWCHRPLATQAAYDVEEEVAGDDFPGSDLLCWSDPSVDDCDKCPRTLAEAYDRGAKDVEKLREELARLKALLNTPELHDFAKGVVQEAAYQRVRWGSKHDAGKKPSDWFWLIAYLAGKALNAHQSNDLDTASHHAISTAAALANWHAAMHGKTDMRPGILPPPGFESPATEPKTK